MNGFIFDIKRYAVNDGPGIRTTVFFKGCPLRCRWCHNPESQERHQEMMPVKRKLGDNVFNDEKTVGYHIESTDLVNQIERDFVFYDESGGGVTFSGGEPLLQPDFLLECLKKCKEKNIQTCIDTAGAVNTTLIDEIIKYTDIFLFDVKTADKKVFEEYIGQGFDIVKNNLKIIAEKAKRVIIRIPVIPDVNFSEAATNQIIHFVRQFPAINEVSLLPFHRTGADKYKRLGKTWKMNDAKNLQQEDIKPMVDIFKNQGFNIFST